MRSQVDTSIYNNFRSDSSIGDIMNLVNGIVGITRYAKENRKQRKEDEDLEYINSTIGKHMQGYNGDPNDMMQRRRNAYNEIVTTRPGLNSYLGERYDNDLKNKFEYDNKALELQSKRLGNQNNNEILKGNQLKNMDSETLSKIKRVDDFTTGMVDVADQSGYEWWRGQFHDGKTINIPHENYQEFMVDPKMSFYRDLINQKKQQKLAGAQAAIEDRDLKMRAGEAGIRKTDSEVLENKANAGKLSAETKKINEKPDGPDKDIFGMESTLRTQYNQLSRDYRTTKDAFEKIKVGAQQNNATGDMALIYGFMRLQDPTSTVREGEYATAEQARGIPQSVIAMYNKAVSGKKLGDDQRKEFVETARNQFAIMERNQQQLDKQYRDITTMYRLDPNRVMGGTVSPYNSGGGSSFKVGNFTVEVQ